MMKGQKIVMLIVTALVIALLIALAISITAYRPLTKVKVGYIPVTSYGLVWIAYEKGYFAQEGLDVELREYQSVAQLVVALGNKEIDGCPLASTAIAAFIKKIDMTIVCGNALCGSALVSKRAFANLQDLSGKVIGTVIYVPGDFVFKEALTQMGINVTYREYLAPSDALTALEDDKVDATILWEPYVTLAEYRNLTIAFWDAHVYPKEYPCCLIVFLDSFVKSNPEAVVKFIRALIKAEKLVEDNPSEAFPLVKKYLPGIPVEIVYKSAFYLDPSLNRFRNPITAYTDRQYLISFYSLLVPSVISYYDFSLLNSKIDLTYYEKAVSSLRAEGITLPSRYKVQLP